MASGSIPVDFFDCDNGFRKYSSVNKKSYKDTT
jgi:hypothetical protein